MLKSFYALIRFLLNMISSRKFLKIAKKYDKEGKITERDAIVQSSTEWWIKSIFDITGSTVEVMGAKNIPQDTAVVFIGNHQGFMDIPLIMGYTNKATAFIAKIELSKIPIISSWMKLMQCTFMDRKSRQHSIQAMAEAVENLKRGYSQVIFPEGTRNKGGATQEFKSGSFKLAYRAGVPIVPITINGTWRVWEEHSQIKGTHVTLIFHPAIPTVGISKEEQHGMPARVQQIVIAALPPEYPRKQ